MTEIARKVLPADAISSPDSQSARSEATTIQDILDTLNAADLLGIEGIRNKVGSLIESVDTHRRFFTDFPHLKMQDPNRRERLISDIKERWQSDPENMDQISEFLVRIYQQYGYPVEPSEAFSALLLNRSTDSQRKTFSFSNSKMTPEVALFELEALILRSKGIIEIISA